VLVSVGSKSVEVGCTGVFVKTEVIVGVANRLSATKLSWPICCQAYTAPPSNPIISTTDNPIRHLLVVELSLSDRPALPFILCFLCLLV
ncbi:uncharacterized protein METZ01_LOCUS102106, partial [marine metagenome]